MPCCGIFLLYCQLQENLRQKNDGQKSNVAGNKAIFRKTVLKVNGYTKIYNKLKQF
jgi:hypothetical protein